MVNGNLIIEFYSESILYVDGTCLLPNNTAKNVDDINSKQPDIPN